LELLKGRGKESETGKNDGTKNHTGETKVHRREKKRREEWEHNSFEPDERKATYVPRKGKEKKLGEGPGVQPKPDRDGSDSRVKSGFVPSGRRSGEIFQNQIEGRLMRRRWRYGREKRPRPGGRGKSAAKEERKIVHFKSSKSTRGKETNAKGKKGGWKGQQTTGNRKHPGKRVQGKILVSSGGKKGMEAGE